jgi:hypothetical protein
MEILIDRFTLKCYFYYENQEPGYNSYSKERGDQKLHALRRVSFFEDFEFKHSDIFLDEKAL